ncbi:MAG: ABC transporter permease [bacterium]
MRGFWTLTKRELRRFLTLPNQTIFPPVMMAILYILIFGYAIGKSIDKIAIGGQTFPYLVFILPGLIMMGIINSGYSNSTTSLFIARYEHFIQDLLVSPLSYLKIVTAYIIGSTVRGVIVGSLSYVVAWIFVDFYMHSLPFVVLFMVISAATFGSFGILVGLWAERWDNIAVFMNYLITPLVFLGGVFYSIDSLPGIWKELSMFNPIFYMVDGFRYGMLGVSDVSPYRSLAVLLAMFVILTGFAFHLFKIGWKLRD